MTTGLDDNDFNERLQNIENQQKQIMEAIENLTQVIKQHKKDVHNEILSEMKHVEETIGTLTKWNDQITNKVKILTIAVDIIKPHHIEYFTEDGAVLRTNDNMFSKGTSTNSLMSDWPKNNS
jgi:seryl-tRNA synthetase